MNKNTKRIYIQDLNANDLFYLPGYHNMLVCVSRRTMDNMTRVVYRAFGDKRTNEYSRVNLSTVDLLTDSE
jgi:hypothetical protein